MGIRSRLKAAVSRRLGGESAAPSAAPQPSAPAAPPPAPAPAPAPATQAATPAKAAPPPEPVTSTAPDPEQAEMDAKVAKHFEKTRRAVLKFVAEQGGTSSMADMHDYSERRYFIAHKKFSDLMEGIVDEGLVSYDHGAGEATITDAGQAYIAD